MAEPKETFDAILKKLATHYESVTNSKMFGMPSGKIKGKAFAGYFHDEMVFKLYGKSHTRALALAGSHLFDPGEMGRPMKQWVQVPFAHADQWEDLAADALEYVLSEIK